MIEKFTIRESVLFNGLNNLLQLAAQIGDGAASLITLKKQNTIVAWGPTFNPAASETKLQVSFLNDTLLSTQFLSLVHPKQLSHFQENLIFGKSILISKYVSVPIYNRKAKFIGTLAIVNFRADELSEVQKRNLFLLAQQIGIEVSRERREANQKKILQKLKLIMDNMPATIAYWDANLRCRFANKTYFDWFGYSPEELYGLNMKELLGETLYEKNRPYIEKALRGIPQHFERDLVRKVQGGSSAHASILHSRCFK